MRCLTVVLIFLLLSIYSCEKCVGGKAVSLPNNCSVIENKTLLIEAESNVKLLREKLRAVRTVTSGVEVTANSFVTFDFLPNVASISNARGPAIKFSSNLDLRRILLPKLVKLKGVPEEIHFSKDNFVHAAYQSTESMQDFQVLQRAAIHGNKARKREEFFAILDEQPLNLLLIALLALDVVGLFLTGACIRIIFKVFGKEEEDDEEDDGENEEGEEDLDRSSSEDLKGDSEATETSLVESKSLSNASSNGADSERSSMSSVKTETSKVDVSFSQHSESNRSNSSRGDSMLSLRPPVEVNIALIN